MPHPLIHSHSLTHSLTLHSLMHSPTHSPTHSGTCSLTHPLTQLPLTTLPRPRSSLTHSLTRSFTSLAHSLTPSLTHPLITHPLTHSGTHSFITHSPAHSFIHSHFSLTNSLAHSLLELLEETRRLLQCLSNTMFAHDASSGAGLEARGTGYGEGDILPDTTFKPLVAQGPCGTHRRCICCGCHRRCNHRRCSHSTCRYRHCHRNVAANISLLLTALPTIIQSVLIGTILLF